MTLYFISGLGIDRRAFVKLKLSPGIAVRYLDWIAPLPHETLAQYAQRLSAGIDTTEDFSLVGLSYGGMIATEIAKTLSPRHTILISSASTRQELPKLYRLAGRLKLHKIVPAVLLKQPTPFHYWFFDARTPKEKQLLKAILKDTSPSFLNWALDSVLKWKNTRRPETIYHIHGETDKVLPLRGVKADRVVKGGGHLVVFTHAAWVSQLLAGRLSQGL